MSDYFICFVMLIFFFTPMICAFSFGAKGGDLKDSVIAFLFMMSKFMMFLFLLVLLTMLMGFLDDIKSNNLNVVTNSYFIIAEIIFLNFVGILLLKLTSKKKEFIIVSLIYLFFVFSVIYDNFYN